MNSNFFRFAIVRWLLPRIGEAATLTVDCDAGERIQQKIALAKPGDTVLVSGTCSENVAIPSEVVRITLDGQGKAVIQAPGTTGDAIFIRGIVSGVLTPISPTRSPVPSTSVLPSTTR
jgi:nitrous oxidase accessory protein NosD